MILSAPDGLQVCQESDIATIARDGYNANIRGHNASRQVRIHPHSNGICPCCSQSPCSWCLRDYKPPATPPDPAVHPDATRVMLLHSSLPWQIAAPLG